MSLPTTPGRAFNKTKREPGTAKAVFEAPIAIVLSQNSIAIGAALHDAATTKPNAQIYGLLCQAIGDHVRFTLAGDTEPTAGTGFRLINGDPPILIPIGPGVFPKFFGESASSELEYQWTA